MTCSSARSNLSTAPTNRPRRTTCRASIYGTLLRIENDLDAARPLLERAVERARRRGEESGDLMPLLVRLARLESDAGNPAAWQRWLAEASEAAGQQVNEEMDSWLAHAQGEIAANQGRLEQARLRAEEVLTLAKANGDLQMQRDGDVLLANIELWGGEPEAAHHRLKPWRERTVTNGPWYMGWITLPLWSSDIEALIALDRLDEAQQVLDDFLERALPYPNPNGRAIAKRCEGLLLAARGELTRRDRGDGSRAGTPCATPAPARARAHAAREGIARATREAQDRGQADARTGACGARAARCCDLGGPGS